MLKIIKKLLAMGLPMATSRFIHTFNTFIVMALIANLGHRALAASFTIAMTRTARMGCWFTTIYNTYSYSFISKTDIKFFSSAGEFNTLNRRLF